MLGLGLGASVGIGCRQVKQDVCSSLDGLNVVVLVFLGGKEDGHQTPQTVAENIFVWSVG